MHPLITTLYEYGAEEDEWRPADNVKGSRQSAPGFHHKNPEAPQHISALDFSNLPFHLVTNFTDIPTMVPLDWAAG